VGPSKTKPAKYKVQILPFERTENLTLFHQLSHAGEEPLIYKYFAKSLLMPKSN
jgi:hypothetical protein